MNKYELDKLSKQVDSTEKSLSYLWQLLGTFQIKGCPHCGHQTFQKIFYTPNDEWRCLTCGSKLREGMVEE